jgi:pimeloyl-ACP methyl ester carboxylesterase
MKVCVNGVRLFFDVDGSSLVPDGPRMKEKPVLLLLHGGPGADHSGFKPHFASQLSDLVQIVYLDHRGAGRSEHGPVSSWSLAQWGDDIFGFCEALGIEQPIVYGVSFGGQVAQSFATRYPTKLSKLILNSTAAKTEIDAMLDAFGRFGGEEARRIAEARWLNPTKEARTRYLEICTPLYSASGNTDPDRRSRIIPNDELALHFSGREGEFCKFDFRKDLARIQCPTLVMAGDHDPITPIVCSETIVAHLPKHLVRFERFPGCGHGIISDSPERAFGILRDFIQS